MHKIKHITLIGVGLIGGSLVLDLKKNDPELYVFGIDRSEENLERALERRVIDSYACEVNEEVKKSDLIIIATPVVAMDVVMQSIQPFVSSDCIIIDVGSTKELTIKGFQIHLKPFISHCVATHPIAGSDRSGALAAQFGLFQNKKVIICPHEEQSASVIQEVEELWKSTGAQIFKMDAKTHDGILAQVSHLPHLLSFAFVHQIFESDKSDDLLFYAGSGFRDFTRIAASHPDVWSDISFANKESLIPLLEQYQSEIQQLLTFLKDGEKDKLKQYIRESKDLRDKWQKTNH